MKLNCINRLCLSVFGVGLLGVCLAITSCNKDSSGNGANASSKRHLVIFSQCNNAEPYRAAQNQALQNLFAASKDVDLTITDAQQDNAKQISQIETAIRQKPDLLIVAPNERAPLTSVMKKARDAGKKDGGGK